MDAEKYFEQYLQNKNNIICKHPYGFKSQSIDDYNEIENKGAYVHKQFALPGDISVNLISKGDTYAITITKYTINKEREIKDTVYYYLFRCSIFAPASEAWDEAVQYLLFNIGKTDEPFRLAMLDSLCKQTDFYIKQYMYFKILQENKDAFSFSTYQSSGWCFKK